MDVATPVSMKVIEPARWDDLVLAGLLLLIGVPQMVLAFRYEHPIDAQGALSMICVVAALAILIWRNSGKRR